ncbi:daptide-type RiPP biosynthesis dehydogenase [Arthrobacter sp. ISL-65]|uniref:daptide-type RiPP biosynthesis dehydogenase n=1 Tax=Arthrobacter sp. ISL-65 TaxID=2819112 RepID=UPI001BE7AD2D|nr:daptide-type RiPP biosynthesis dehydogenase [Arthrobacter sp. ISL-65]MBT2547264.1 iron-containing alcohol dehydrogenase [Arthrobacter sp. ISL-65]
MSSTVRTVPAGPWMFTSMPDFVNWVSGSVREWPDLPVLTVIDPAIPSSPGGQQLLQQLQGAADLFCVPPAADEAALLRTAERAPRAKVVVGIGGGAAMDTAKLVPAIWHPGHRMAITSRSRSGHVVLPDGPSRGNALGLVPTTVGTGSESSMSACLTQGARKRLISGSGLGADAVLLDSGLTATLPVGMLLAGALEAIFRLSTPFVMTAKPRRSADSLALASIRALVEAGNEARTFDPGKETARASQVRRDIAELSSFSQTGWSSLGRHSYGTLPWIIATELSMAYGISKMDAVAAILPAYWQRIESGDARFGSSDRLRDVGQALAATAGASARTPVGALEQVLSQWGLTQPLPLQLSDIHRIAQQISRAWGGGLPMLQGLASADVAAFLAEAAGAHTMGGRATGAA